ncbi:MAG: ferritin family protein [Proteobacteria bacterium]|nr:ferritin family protein [Pseudomonadota bacterium]
MFAHFNANEILEIACQIERNGAAFYRAAAELASLSDVADILLDLAHMEDGHEQTFLRMKSQSSQSTANVPDPDETAIAYLSAIAGNHVFTAGTHAADQFRPDTTAQEVLKLALQAEFAAIAFFQGLLEFMPTHLGPERLKAIIREEQEHVVLLSRQLRALQPTAD